MEDRAATRLRNQLNRAEEELHIYEGKIQRRDAKILELQRHATELQRHIDHLSKRKTYYKDMYFQESVEWQDCKLAYDAIYTRNLSLWEENSTLQERIDHLLLENQRVVEEYNIQLRSTGRPTIRNRLEEGAHNRLLADSERRSLVG